jgi:NAD(P)-dependent dehydrogenase (short-subunit alcohol dehydrogenase family)
MPKTLIITGASRGIGAATAILAASQGWQVAVNYAANSLAADAVVRQIRAAGGTAVAVQADVSLESGVLRLFETVDAKLGRLDGLVNNAGVVDIAQRVDEMSVARLQRMWATNITSKHGGAGGAIVNVSSVAARLGSPAQYVDYAASKAAIDTFTLGLAKEVAAEGIRVNAVRPGIIDTDIHASGGDPDRASRMASQLPMQRAGTADEIAQSIVWLLSEAASYTTGAVIDVAGGR